MSDLFNWDSVPVSPAVKRITEILMEPVLVDSDVTLSDGTVILAGTDMGALDAEVLDALEAYYIEHVHKFKYIGQCGTTDYWKCLCGQAQVKVVGS